MGFSRISLKKGKKQRSYKGVYEPRFPKKYVGKGRIIFRSLWERRVMKWLDENSNVLLWASEPFRIPYLAPTDKRFHGYFPDFWVKMKTKNDKILIAVLEIKPLKETVAPKKPKTLVEGSFKGNKSYMHDIYTWSINNAKWEAAKKYCEEKNWRFIILTENEIFDNKFYTKKKVN